MIDDLPKYEQMQDSKVLWLGKIPEHWTVLPNRAVFTQRISKGHSDKPLLSVTISRGIVLHQELLRSTIKKDSSNTDKSNYKLVKPNDIAYNKMRAWQGALGFSRYQGIVSPAYVVVHLRDTLNKIQYFHYLMRTPLYIKEIERRSYGIVSDQWSLRYQHFKCIYSPIPPPEEQEAIVKFLHYANHKINSYIKAKRKLIKFLEEQKKVVISQAVTKGLDLSVPMRDSKNDLLGQIPLNWECFTLKHVLSLNTGGFWGKDCTEGDIGTPVVRSTEVNLDGSWRDRDPIRRLLSAKEKEMTLLKVDDLIVTKSSGSEEHIGKTALVSNRYYEGCSYSNFMQRLRVNDLCLPLYLWYYLNSSPGREQMFYLSNTTTGLRNLSAGILANIYIPLPSRSQQTDIIKHLNRECVSLTDLINKSRKEIDLLKELQTRLISDVVTGQVDVRMSASKLPKFVNETLSEVKETT